MRVPAVVRSLLAASLLACLLLVSSWPAQAADSAAGVGATRATVGSVLRPGLGPTASPTVTVSPDRTSSDAPSGRGPASPAGRGAKSTWFILLGIALVVGSVVVGTRGRRR